MESRTVETITTSGPMYVDGGILHDADDLVAAWICDRLGAEMPRVAYRAFAVVAEGTPQGPVQDLTAIRILGGVYWFNHYDGPDQFDISAGVTFDNITAVTPDTIRKLLEYPFGHLKLPRITVHINATNERALRQAEAMGFKREGIMRKAGKLGSDVVILGLLPDECPFWNRTH